MARAAVRARSWPSSTAACAPRIRTSAGGCCRATTSSQDDGAPQDGDGHGTHVTGIVAANAGNDVGVASVAPGAQVLPVRVLGDDGSGSAEDVVAGHRLGGRATART